MKTNQLLRLVLILLCTLVFEPLVAQCNLEIELIAECDNNGTPCNESDDFYVISMIVENPGPLAMSQFVANFGPLSGGPFPYSNFPIQLGTVPADPFGGSICLDITDENDPTCTGQECSEPLIPCVTALNITFFEMSCNDNRTANDASDDFYEIRVVASTGLGSTWPGLYEIDINGTKYGMYAANEIVDITYPADGSSPVMTLTDNIDPSCRAFRFLGDLNPCSTPCSQQPAILNTVCVDNGTPNPNDDFYQVQFISNAVTQGRSGQFSVTTPFVPPLPFNYGVPNVVLIPARGQDQVLVFNDVDYDDCGAEIEIGPLDACSKMCEVNLDSIRYECNDNGTPDPTDDFYNIYIIVSGEDAGSEYQVRIAGDTYGPFDYNEEEVFRIPADGTTPRINFRDVDFPTQCGTFTIADSLLPCSFPCDLTLEGLELVCDGKSTSSPMDDEYTISLTMVNPLAMVGDSFEIEINGVLFGPFAYNELVNWNWSADGSAYDVIFRDRNLMDRCQIIERLGPFVPCSSDCELDIEVTNVLCDDNNTRRDPSDDRFSFTLTVNGMNVGPEWRTDDVMMTQRPYGQSANYGPYLISNGAVVLNVQDVQDAFCVEAVTIAPPAPCSDECFLTLVSREDGPCNDNETGPDTTDDFFFMELWVEATNAGMSNTYEAVLNGAVLNSYSYGRPEVVGPLPSNGVPGSLLIRDAINPNCSLSVPFNSPPCSSCDQNTAEAGPDQEINCSANEVILQGNSSAPGTFQWRSPSGQTFNGRNPSVGEIGVYVLTVTFDKECTARDSVTVTRDINLPVADPGTEGVLTCKVDSVTVGGGQTSQGTNIIYVWRDGGGVVVGRERFYTTRIPGTYCLQATDTLLDCSSASNCVDVIENKRAPSGRILVDPNNALDCRVDSILLSNEDQDSTIWFWEKRTNFFYQDTFWVMDTGKVFLIVEDTINGCTTRLDIDIESLVDFPFIQVSPPAELTCTVNEVTIDASASQAGPSILYQWYDENGQPIPGASQRTLTVSTPGRYIIQSLDDITGCLNADTVEVLLDELFHVASAGEDTYIPCDSNSVVLDGSRSTQQNGITYAWQNLQGSGQLISGDQTLFPTVDGAGVFELTVQDGPTGCESKDTVLVEQFFAPMLDQIIVLNEQCGGEENGLIDVRGIRGVRPFEYELNGRAVDTNVYEELKPGLFFFRVIDSLGCSTDTLLEVKEGNFFDFQIEGDTFIVRGDSTVLSVDINIGDDQIDQIYWEEDSSVFCFRCREVTVSPDTTTTYTFRLIDVNGCAYSFNFVVKIQDKNDIYVPNIFTPNGDTQNEVLHVFGKHLKNILTMRIYNRWGELVFYNENISPGPVWDGRWNGNFHVPAALTYLIDAEFEDGSIKQFTGSVTLLR